MPAASFDDGRVLRTLAIVPAYNEAGAIGHVVRDLQALEGVDVVVIDDGSIDATATEARAAGARVLRLPFNLGIGGAVQTGYLAALAGDYDAAVQVDGDGQHLPSQIAVLIAAHRSTGADLLIGTRFQERGAYRPPIGRRLGIRIFSRVVSAITRTPLTDTTSGFRLASRRTIALFAAAYPHDYPEVESIVVASRAGLVVREVQVQMRHRASGRSSITPVRSIYYMVKVLMAIGVELLRRRPATATSATER